MYQQPNRFLSLMKDIWPTIQKAVNTSLFFVFGVIKSIISEGIKMLRNQY